MPGTISTHHLDLIHTSPVVCHALAAAAAAHPDASITLMTFSWTEFVRSWDFSAARVVVDAFLDDHVPLAMKVRALRSIGSEPVVLGPATSAALLQRARMEGAVAWLTPDSAPDALVRAAMNPRWSWPENTQLPGIHLSDRELQILSLYASRRALSIGSLSRTLGIQPETVRAHLRRGRKRYSDAGITVSNRGSLAAALVADGYLIPDTAWVEQGRW